MDRNTLIIRMLQLGLIAFAVMSFSRGAETASQALDVALNRPATVGDQRRTILQELPAYFQATDPNTVVQDALAQGDLALAQVYIDYASGLRGTPLSEETLAQFEKANSWWATTKRSLTDCTIGAVWRESDNMTAIGCQLATDLFVIGDVADIVNEGADWYYGKEYDEIILGLSIIGASTSALSLVYPGAAAAAGGIAAAKVVVRPTAKGFKMSGPLRTAVKRAIDFDALELARKNTNSLAQAQKYLTNPKQFMRPKETAVLMDGLSHIAVIGKQTDAATATRVLRRASSLEEVSGAAKIIDVTGEHSKAVLNIMGVKAIKFAKVAKPLISASKMTYKASVIGFGFLAGFGALLIEFALRKNMRLMLLRRGTIGAGDPAPLQGNLGRTIGTALVSALLVAGVVGVLMFRMQMEHEASIQARTDGHNLQASSAVNRIYLDEIEQRAEQSEEIRQWVEETGFDTVCRKGGNHVIGALLYERPMTSVCRDSIAKFHAEFGI